MSEKTSLENRMQILAELWLEYRNDQNFEDFIKYNDLGLPLAYAIAEGIVETTPPAENYINETFELLLAGLGIEDENFENLDEILGMADE
jgi:hypothetical protein